MECPTSKRRIGSAGTSSGRGTSGPRRPNRPPTARRTGLASPRARSELSYPNKRNTVNLPGSRIASAALFFRRPTPGSPGFYSTSSVRRDYDSAHAVLEVLQRFHRKNYFPTNRPGGLDGFWPKRQPGRFGFERRREQSKSRT